MINKLKDKIQAIKDEAIDTTNVVKKDMWIIMKDWIRNNVTKKNKPICNIIWYWAIVLTVAYIIYLFMNTDPHNVTIWSFLKPIWVWIIWLIFAGCTKQYQFQKIFVLEKLSYNLTTLWNTIIKQSEEIIKNKDNKFSDDVVISAQNMIPNVKRILDDLYEVSMLIHKLWTMDFWLDTNIKNRQWIDIFDKITNTIMEDVTKIAEDLDIYAQKLDLLLKNEI